MNKDWGEIFPGLEHPVRGQTFRYQTAERDASTLERKSRAVEAEFANVSASNSLGELEGQAADQLATLVKEIDGSFSDLPDVFHELADIFDDHERKLTRLRKSASDALAKANTRWSALQQARSDNDEADAALASIDRQIHQLQYAVAADPTSQTELDDLRDSRWSYSNRVSGSSATVRDAEDELELSREEHGRLVDAEKDLIDDTVNRLKGVDLDDLKDPNRLVEFATSVGKWFYELGESLVTSFVELAKAVANGEWMDALWRLSDLLGAVLKVLAIIGLALAVFASGGLALGLIVGLMVAKLVVDTALASTQHPHPDTGQPKSWGEVAVDAVMIGVTLATAGVGNSSSLQGLSKLKIGGLTPFPAASVGARLVGPGGSTLSANRSVVQNAINVFRPVSGAGAPLFGAAATSTSRAAGEQLAAEAIDKAAGQVTGAIADQVTGEFTNTGLTTSSEAWTDSGLVDYARDSPMTSQGIQKINADAASVNKFSTSGPSMQPGFSIFQLAGTP